MKECKCFNNFKSTINHLSVGNPDDDKNKTKSLRNDKIELQQEIERLRNRLTFNHETHSPSSTSSDYKFKFGALNDSASDASMSYHNL